MSNLGKYDDIDYWGKRQAMNMYKDMEDAEIIAKSLSDIYLKTARYVSDGIDKIYDRFKDKNHLTDSEATHILANVDPNRSIKDNYRNIQNKALSDAELNRLAQLEAPAYQYRISLLEDKMKQIDNVMQNVYKQELQITTSHYEQQAEKAYNRTIYDIQQRTGITFSFSQVDEEQIDKVLNMDWSGKNYSKRIWQNTQQLAEDLKKELIVNLITGRTETETAAMIDAKYLSGYKDAKRLVRTESAFVSNELSSQAYEECGIEKYVYVATLDLRTSEICRGLDSKVFDLKDKKVGKNYPPMHPWCRSTTIAYIDDEALKSMQRRFKNADEQNVSDKWMDYDTWYKKFGKDLEKKKLKEEKRK